MRSEDIPQDATPQRIRDVVSAIAGGARTPEDVEGRTQLSRRHVHYHLNAARILGFVRRKRGWYSLTDLGKEWLDTPEEAAADRAVFARGLGESTPLRDVEPNLLGDPAPTRERLAERIALLTRMAPETAKRRADTLIRYRRYARGDEEPSLFSEGGGLTRARAAEPVAIERGRPIRCLQVRNFGCLSDVRADLGSFSVVIGANAAGKTTLFDVIGFTADALQGDVSKALLDRARSLEELLWFGEGDRFEFAIEFSIPEGLATNGYTDARYELAVGRAAADGAAQVLWEGLFLKDRSLPPELVHAGKTPPGWRRVLSLSDSGTAWYGSERTTWKTVFQIGTRKLALSQVQEDRTKFPVALWVRSVLLSGVQRLELNSKAMRRPASPLLVGKFLPDGSNLPIVVKRLKAEDPKRARDWVNHLATALPDLKDIRVVEREEDKHAYLKLVYEGGLELPAWRVSDGTLRLLALTLIAFVGMRDAVYLIEEPENGIHPQALEVVYQALSQCYDSQVLVATHSTVFLSIIPPERFLILSKEGGQTRIARGLDHPVLRSWQREADLGTLFASGVLG